MGCANSKAGGATGAYGAPEEENAGANAPPKVMVDGEAQDGAVAVNGNAVTCANGVEEGAGGEEKDACNGDVSAKNEDAEDAPSSGDKSEQNGGCENEGGKSIQDGEGETDDTANDETAKQEDEEEGTAKEEENNSAEATDSTENVESRENNEEEKAE